MKTPFSLKALGVIALTGGGVVFFRPASENSEAPPSAFKAPMLAAIRPGPSVSANPPAAPAVGTGGCEGATNPPPVAVTEPGAREPASSISEAPAFQPSPAALSTQRWQRVTAARRNAGRVPAPAHFPTAASPGTTLAVDGRIVTVEASVEVAAEPDPALSVLIGGEPEPTDPADPTEVTEPAAAEVRAESRGGPAARGLTYEEELFRTKWGWAAYDQARRAALTEPQTAEVSP